MDAGACIIITGPRGSGKTRLLRAAVEKLAASGRRIRAVIQPDEGRGPEGRALAFSMELLSGVEGRLLAERIPLARELRLDEDPPGRGPGQACFALGRFLFEGAAFARAFEFIREGLEGDETLAALGLDEIGRLEVERGEGLEPCLDLALAAVSRPGGPRLLLCSSREVCAAPLERRARDAGLQTKSIVLPQFEEGLLSSLGGLGL